MEKNSRIFVAGHRGMVGSAIVRKLVNENHTHILERTSAELDLRNQSAVEDFFKHEKPEYVFLSAAKVGGIHANNVYRAEFLYDTASILGSTPRRTLKDRCQGNRSKLLLVS